VIRRIELLPEVHLQHRRQRRNNVLIVVAGLVAFTLLVGYWLVLGTQVTDAENELASVTARNSALQAEIDELQRFADMDAELKDKQASLATVMAGDVDWPGIMTDVAMVIPGEIWLTSLTGSAGTTEGATQAGTETAPVRVSQQEPFGRLQVLGNSLSMPGAAKWLVRLGTVKEFHALWLNNATKSELEGEAEVVSFDSTLELNQKSASDRFQENTR
jgi:Tfp pilus assembly protein PilN